MDNSNRYLSAKEAADMLHIGKSTLYSYVKQGLITPTKIGRKFLFHPDELHKQIKCNSSIMVSRQVEALTKFKSIMSDRKIEISPDLLAAIETILEVVMTA